MNFHLKLTRSLITEMQQSLRVPHKVALERVGFLACQLGMGKEGAVILGQEFFPVSDANYERDRTVGARISDAAVREALEIAIEGGRSMFFVHEHEHLGVPRPSRTDLDCWRELCPNFRNVLPGLPHGGLILSQDAAMALVWSRPGEDIAEAKISISDWPLKILYPERPFS
jgi:hypothetical protein